MKERRSCSRGEIKVPARFHSDGGSNHFCTIRNISLGGLFIECQGFDDLVERSIEISLFLPTDGGAEVEYHLLGQVVRAEENGLGINLDGLDVTSFRALQKLMHIRDRPTV